MADTFLKTYVMCMRCLGTKIVTLPDAQGNPVQQPCDGCDGTGVRESAQIDTVDMRTDITLCKRRLKKIMDKLGVGDD